MWIYVILAKNDRVNKIATYGNMLHTLKPILCSSDLEQKMDEMHLRLTNEQDKPVLYNENYQMMCYFYQNTR